MRTLLLNLSVCLAIGSFNPAPAAIIAHWEADDIAGSGGSYSTAATTADPLVVASNISRGGGGSLIAGSTGITGTISNDPRFAGVDWNAATPTSYLEFSVGPKENTLLDIDGFQFYGIHAAENRSVNYRLDVSTNNGSTYATAGSGTVVDGATRTWDNYSVPLALDDLSEPVFFRLYFWGMNAINTLILDDLRVTGSAAAIPEPSTIVLGSLFALGLLARHGLRRRGSLTL